MNEADMQIANDSLFEISISSSGWSQTYVVPCIRGATRALAFWDLWNSIDLGTWEVASTLHICERSCETSSMLLSSVSSNIRARLRMRWVGKGSQ
jgi:hypothetical protein